MKHLTTRQRRRIDKQLTDAIVALELSAGYLQDTVKQALVDKLVTEREANKPVDGFLYA